MSDEARNLNGAYLAEMTKPRPLRTMARIRELWWDDFIDSVNACGPEHTLDRLDTFMAVGRDRLFEMATEHADKGADPGTSRHITLRTQFLKSNTGKMFERFVGLALAQCLREADSDYCIQPFVGKAIVKAPGIERTSFRVNFEFGDGSLYTYIDADIFAYNPTDPDADVYMISVKSTLKDRFHNVPFWNLLRRAAVSDDFPEIAPHDRDVLRRMKYIAVCSDLAEEQPDFGTDRGARNLLQIDASLLDGAYVTSSRALGLPQDCTNHLGDVRQHAFYRYSCFYGSLT